MATIKDVAKLAEVTVTTVSRVLNNRGYISAETRKKVNNAIKKLNYRPNEIARSLFRKRSNIIGLIFPTILHPFFGELANYIEFYAYRSGYKILLCNSNLDCKKEKDYLEMLERHKVDGIIMGSHTLEVEEFLSINLPIITFDRQIGTRIPYIASDNYEGGKLAAQLLIGSGCKKLACIAGNFDLKMFANDRYKAFSAMAKRHKIDCVITQTTMNVFNLDHYGELVDAMFEKHPDIDGVFSSDTMALNVIQACWKRNRKIPADVKIVGYDDIKIAGIVTPPLTTIRQPVDRMAAEAVALLLKCIRGERVQIKNIFPVSLIRRHTV